ncbi:large subunit ribosomal protein L7Ae [Pancytospora philotis]|nr:large subunit ribosomal protein L7Ae [Pancytospora philotis]
MDQKLLPDGKAQKAYALLSKLRDTNNVKVGYNEVIKSLNNSSAMLVIVAEDTTPYSIVAPLPVLCEQKGVDIVYVSSKAALGKACKLQVGVIACAIFADRNDDSSSIQTRIRDMLN